MVGMVQTGWNGLLCPLWDSGTSYGIYQGYKWDEKDRWEYCAYHGTVGHPMGSLNSCTCTNGTNGRGWTGGTAVPIVDIPWDPSYQQYKWDRTDRWECCAYHGTVRDTSCTISTNGMGWTGGITAPVMGQWDIPWDPSYQWYKWDEMDR